jgi:hypothetical protein
MENLLHFPGDHGKCLVKVTLMNLGMREMIFLLVRGGIQHLVLRPDSEWVLIPSQKLTPVHDSAR